MTALGKRLGALEARDGRALRLPFVHAYHGETREDALAAAALPPDARNPLLRWRAAQ